MHKYLEYAFSHDEFDASTQRLREYKWGQAASRFWRQPTAFGPMPGPRQHFDGASRSDMNGARCETITIIFKTSATMLRNLLPSNRFRFESLDTVAYASLRFQTLANLDWLGGYGYHLLGFYPYNVQYTDDAGISHRGSYMPVMFENMAEPIVSGREELGFPKVFSDIAVSRESETCDITMSWKGAKWCRIHLSDLQEDAHSRTLSDVVLSEKVFVHKFLPATGREANFPDANYVAMMDPKKEALQVLLEKVETCDSSAKIEFDACSKERLPTLLHIVSRLAELPIFELVDASIVQTRGIPSLKSLVRL